jgi:acetylornithine deacetylase/succinyl-diaminopimelate desuccinylase-like protein
MAISTTGGSGLYIGGTSAIDFTTDQSALDAFEAVTDWIKVGEIEDLGEIGDSSADVTFSALGDNRVRHLKGARDAGTMTVVTGADPADPGQQALRAAEKTKFNYNFRIVYEDAPDAGSTDSVDYFRALVMSARKNNGTADNVARRTFALGINSPVITVDSDSAVVLTMSPVAGALTGGTEGVAYTATISVSNEVAPPTYAVTAGALPAGLTLSASTGVLSGTPTTDGSYSFTITATDAYGNSGSAAYTLAVANP